MSLNQPLTFVFNGEVRSMESQLTVKDLLERESVTATRFVVVINDEVIPKIAWDDTRLNIGDSIDIVSPISGG
jgi:thiamine biosynthesis protein ThiS